MNIHTGTYELKELDKINIILGKNGCGKSTLLRRVEEYLSRDPTNWGKTRYITPERGGTLVYEAGVEQNSIRDVTWFSTSRRTNQFNQFRQQSIAQYRRLKDIVLEGVERSVETGNSSPPLSFNQYINRINQLLDNIQIRRVDARTQGGEFFTIHDKQTGNAVSAADISSGEAELISLGIECLIFERECIPEKENILFIDEPDVHLHPDLQVRLIEFITQLVNGTGFKVIIATHSTAILGALQSTEHCKIGFKRAGENSVEFKYITEPYKKILPVFGAHPLSNIFNAQPILLVEGEDDERIWQTVVRASKGEVKIYPCSTDSITHMPEFEKDVKDLIQTVYDNGKAYSLRDRDNNPEQIDDNFPIIRMRLSCRNSESLILSDDVLKSLSSSWEKVKTNIVKWLELNTKHPHYSVFLEFSNSGFDRKNADIKKVRNTLMGQIIGSDKPWEVAVGQCIAKIRWNEDSKFDSEGDLLSFLGKKLVETILLSRKENL